MSPHCGKKTPTGFNLEALLPGAALGLLLYTYSPTSILAAEADPGADLRKARIAKKIRDADYWQTCQLVGAELRSKKTDPKKAEEHEVLFNVTMLPPYSIPNAHLPAIRNREPELGMSMCGVIAALGLPNRNNRNVSRRGERFQLVYERPRRYVYLEGEHAGNARVTSWQD